LLGSCYVVNLAVISAFCGMTTPAQSQDGAVVTPVTLHEDPSSFTLSNAIIKARVSKRSGDLTSLQYKGFEILTDKSGHAGGYWSHDTNGGKETLHANHH